MKAVNIFMADGSADGPLIISSTMSKFTAVRVSKADAKKYDKELDQAGIYFLLVGNDSVYVGESGLETVEKRIFKPHSGKIDSSWHTVIGFVTSDKTIDNNQLLYLENAMCEYVHNHYTNCLTTTPAKANCNHSYRANHYKLSTGKIIACDSYVKDIEEYINYLGPSIFPTTANVGSIQSTQFYYKNVKRDTYGTAEILIHTGNTLQRKTVLKAGSKISKSVSQSFGSANNIINMRNQYIANGLIVNRILKQDISFSSQSGAGQFLNGTSFDGNSNWKTINGNIPLKQLLK